MATENSGAKEKKIAEKNTMLRVFGSVYRLVFCSFLFSFEHFYLVSECLFKHLAKGNILFK